jgi:hypothetical protein
MKIHIPLPEQVVSQKVAEELNEAFDRAGIEVEENYAWYRMKETHRGRKVPFGTWRKWELSRSSGGAEKWWDIKDMRERVPTYTLPELLRVLPKTIKAEYDLEYVWILNSDSISYVNGSASEDNDIVFLGETGNEAYFKLDDKTNLADITANLIIWGVKNGHIGGGE